MSTINLGTTYLDQQKAYLEHLHNEFKKEEIRMYAQLAGMLIGTVAGTIIAIKFRKI